MFGVNHLGHFLLTLLLLERLKASGPSRVVNVASSSYGRGQLDFSLLVDLRDSAEGCGFRQTYRKYCDSKLCNILFTRELSRRLQGSQVTCYSLHPGQRFCRCSEVLQTFCRRLEVLQGGRLLKFFFSFCRTHSDRFGSVPWILDEGLGGAHRPPVLHGSRVWSSDHSPLCPGARHRTPQRSLLQVLHATDGHGVQGQRPGCSQEAVGAQPELLWSVVEPRGSAGI